MNVPGTDYGPVPIGVESEPAPSDNPILYSVRIGDSFPVRALHSLQSASAKVTKFLSSLDL